MPTISLSMIVKNEEALLARCLDSVQAFVDEIIIVDTGSTDRTKDIAAQYTDNIFDWTQQTHSADARNFSFSKATMDYIFWLDAGDVVKTEELNKLCSLKNTLSPLIDVVYLDHMARLVKRENHFLWFEPVHEHLLVFGKKQFEYIPIARNKKEMESSARSLDSYKQMVENDDSFSPRSAYYFAKELKAHGQDAEALHYYNLFLDASV